MKCIHHSHENSNNDFIIDSNLSSVFMILFMSGYCLRAPQKMWHESRPNDFSSLHPPSLITSGCVSLAPETFQEVVRVGYSIRHMHL